MHELKLPAHPWQFLHGRSPDSIEEYVVTSENDHTGKCWKFKQIYIGDSSGRRIAEVTARTLNDTITYEEFPPVSRLILAAPELLEACIEVLACLANANGRQHERDILQRAIDKVTKQPLTEHEPLQD